MPKQKITKEMVVDTAFALARAGGMEQVLVKNIAQELECSVQPIYSYCNNIEGLRRDVMDRTVCFVREFTGSRIDADDLFRSTGQAYIQLAKEEPWIFKMFVLHEREGIASLDDLYEKEAGAKIAEEIAKELHISVRQAKQLHLHMLIYTIGIGTIFSMTTPGITTDEILRQQEMAYDAFLKQTLQDEANLKMKTGDR